MVISRRLKGLAFVSFGYLVFTSYYYKTVFNPPHFKVDSTAVYSSSSSPSVSLSEPSSDSIDSVKEVPTILASNTSIAPSMNTTSDVSEENVVATVENILEVTSQNNSAIKQIEIYGKEAMYVSGKITANFYEDAKRLKIPYKIVSSFISALQSRVNFRSSLRKGDSFSLIYNADGVLLYAQIKVRGREHKVYRYNDGSKDGYYFSDGASNVEGKHFKIPVSGARVSSKFGYRVHPIKKVVIKHNGVDYAAPKGTPVRAMMSGVVSVVAYNRGYGHYVEISHSGGYKTLYAHLSKVSVKVGQSVGTSDTIGGIGMSGTATGYHVHVELKKNGLKLDPQSKVSVVEAKLCGNKLSKFKNHVTYVNRKITGAATRSI